MSAVEETYQEKRMTYCLYETWERIAGSNGLPSLKKIRQADIAPFKDNLVLLDRRNVKNQPTFQVIGNKLTDDLDIDLLNKPVTDVPRRTMLSRVPDHYLEVLANRAPIAFEAEFVNRDGEKALYRGVLLPFSDDNKNINFILGGVRWILEKNVTLDDDKPSIEDLVRSISQGVADSRADEEPEEKSETILPEESETVTEIEDTAEPLAEDTLKLELEEFPEPQPENVEPLTSAQLEANLRQIIGYINKEDANHNRSRDSLYNILEAIYGFHQTCIQSPNAFTNIVKQHGLKAQKRAPFTPALKMCLGKDYDKTRLTEYAAALGLAQHMNVEISEFQSFIKGFPYGIKGCVKEMRSIKKTGVMSMPVVSKGSSLENAKETLRDMPTIGSVKLQKIILGGNTNEFCLLLAKRNGHYIDILKVLDEETTKIEPIIKQTAFIQEKHKIL